MPPQLTRLIWIFGILIGLFIVVRWVARPESFGEFGHYRGNALREAASRDPHYVDRAACTDCHEQEVHQNTAGPHAKISCQACHGPGMSHIEEPTTANITRPDVKEICLRCHEKSLARPARFPQIEPQEHTDGQSCEACHVVHNPQEIH